jgi:hypothetical protein
MKSKIEETPDHFQLLRKVRTFVNKQIDRLEDDFEALTPEERIKYLPKFIEICVPKFSNTQNHDLEDNPYGFPKL